jgi:gamma-D-glutamyl-L-lysine dipeptidyl-peptidase
VIRTIKLLTIALLFLGAALFSACSQDIGQDGLPLPVPLAEQPAQEQPTGPIPTAPTTAPELAEQLLPVPPSRYVIDVSVATLWKEPGQARSLDQPSLQNPADIAGWTRSLKLKDKLWLVGRTESQALLGQEVKVLESQGEWTKVAILGQKTSKHAEGYPGWLPAKQLTLVDEGFVQPEPNASYALVKAPTSWLVEHSNPQMKFMEISFNTKLPVLDFSDEWVVVKTPSDGAKRIRMEHVELLHHAEERAQPKGEDLVLAARMFLELPYLWAGASGFGFDCSGFIHSLYSHFGVDIPRDTMDQMKSGTVVQRSELAPGDLIFFAYDQGKGKIHHVAMYAGDGMIIHSPKSERSVELIPLTTKEYAVEYAGARRILK